MRDLGQQRRQQREGLQQQRQELSDFRQELRLEQSNFRQEQRLELRKGLRDIQRARSSRWGFGG